MRDIIDKIALTHIAKIYQDIIIISDSTNRIIYASELFYSRTGYTAADIERANISAYQLYEGGLKEAARITRKLIEMRGVTNHKTRLRGREGKLYDVDLTVVGLPPGQKKPQFVIGVNRNVRALEQLLIEVGKLNDDFEKTRFVEDPEKYIIILSDRSGRILYCNKPTIDMLGYRYEEIMGRKVADFYLGGRNEAVRRITPILKAYHEREHPRNFVWQNSFLIHRNGTHVPVKIAFRIYYENIKGKRKISTILGINQDMRELRKIGFFSYASKDRKKATTLRESLGHLKIQTWIDEQNIRVSDQIPHEVAKGIQNADYFFFCMTPRSVKSDWCLSELSHALMIEKKEVLELYLSF